MSTVEPLPPRRLGSGGPQVSALGYGAMVLVDGMYGRVERAAAIRLLRTAADLGVTLVDTADLYGEGDNERLVSEALGDRDDVLVATKFGFTGSEDPAGTRVQHNWGHELYANGRPERVRAAAEASLRRLGREAIDLFYLHVPDPSVPVEETVGAMAQLVGAGLVRHLGVSNTSADEVRAAASVAAIAAVQVEWSLWSRQAEQSIVPAARQAGAGIVPWSPLGSGFLAGDVDVARDGTDFRVNNPRFDQVRLAENVDRFAPLRAIAQEHGLHPAQLALAWLLAQGDDVVPIPGTRDEGHLRTNLAAARVALPDEVVDAAGAAAAPGTAVGRPMIND